MFLSTVTFWISLAQIFLIAKFSMIMVCTGMLSMPISSTVMRTVNDRSKSSTSRVRCRQFLTSTAVRTHLRSISVCDMLSNLNAWRFTESLDRVQLETRFNLNKRSPATGAWHILKVTSPTTNYAPPRQ